MLTSMPKNDNLRELWLSFIAPTNPRLTGLTKEQLINKRVCSKHFDKYQFGVSGHRMRYAYPCLFSELEIALGEPRRAVEWSILNEHNYFLKGEIQNLEPVTKTSRGYHFLPRLSSTTPFTGYVAMERFSNAIYGVASTVEVQTSVWKQPPFLFVTTGEKNDDTISVIEEKADTVQEPPSFLFVTAGDENDDTISVIDGKDLTKRKPSKKRKLLKQIITILRKIQGNSAMQTLQQAQKILSSPIIEKFHALPKYAQNFIEMQLGRVIKKKIPQSLTLDEKLMALSLMKQKPKFYKFLGKIFTLPNKRTLSKLSGNIDFEPGLNPHIFENIKEAVNNWDEKKRLCSILYNKVSLKPHVTFDENKNEIIGFVEVDGKKEIAYCDQALVFMVRGVCVPWKQHIAYYFVQETISAIKLYILLKDIVVQVAQTGLIPIALVSDQDPIFRTFIRNLRLDTIQLRNQGLRDDGTVEIGGHLLNVFYDPPHLLKSLRNHFINKDVLWRDKTASWKDIQYIYDIDSKLGYNRALPKLTAYHIDHNKMRKMNVRIAAQTLSKQTAAILKYTDALRQDPQSTMKTTAAFIEFVDNLFDSVNGYPEGSKNLRKPVKSNSAHEMFWNFAIKQLKNIKFIDRNSKVAVQRGQPRYIKVPCLECWITTLESFKRLSKVLFEKYNVDLYYPRYINQDPLEDFFGRLRALNLNANTFKYSFKSLMLSMTYSRSSNCEQDQGETILNISHMYNENHNVNKENEMIVDPNSNYTNIEISSRTPPGYLMGQVIDEKRKVHCSAYTAGLIFRKITKTINCKWCMHTNISKNIKNIHRYIQHREYKAIKNNNLEFPNENFIRLYRDATEIIHSYLNVFCYTKYDLCSKLKNILRSKLSHLSIIGCRRHIGQVQDTILRIIIRLQVRNWCNIINKILNGTVDEKYVLKMNDPQIKALKKYKSLRSRKK